MEHEKIEDTIVKRALQNVKNERNFYINIPEQFWVHILYVLLTNTVMREHYFV